MARILNILFAIAVLGLMIYLSVGIDDIKNQKINFISFDGNYHLTKEQYLAFANLYDKNLFENLSVQIIKDRVEKHPYIQHADVRYEGNNKVSVRVTEKSFESLIVDSSAQFIITDKLQVLPVLDQTKKIDYPVISNPVLRDGIKSLSIQKKNNDILTASKIISAVKLINIDLYNSLSSVDMQNGDDIILYFSNLNYPLIIGRGGEIQKVVYFNSFWKYLKGKEINNYMEYVDLRFAGHVYLGIKEQNSQEAQKKS
jgi:cell division protein FtsQ